MAVRQGFETLNFNPTSVDQLLVPVKLQADTNALFGNILGSIKDVGDYLSPAEDYYKKEYENRIGVKVKNLSNNLLTNKNVSDMDIDELRKARNEHQSFFAPGGVGYKGMQEKQNYLALQKRILENKDISGETKNDWLKLAKLQYAKRFKDGYDFSDIIPSKEIDVNKLALDAASKVEKFEASIKEGASQAERIQMAKAYGIPENSAVFNILTEREIRSPEKIRAVLTDYFNSNPEIQAMYRQNDILRQVNPNRMSNEEMQEHAFRSAINATAINNYKRHEDFKFMPKYMSGYKKDNKSENGLVQFTYEKPNSDLYRSTFSRAVDYVTKPGIMGTVAASRSKIMPEEYIKNISDNLINELSVDKNEIDSLYKESAKKLDQSLNEGIGLLSPYGTFGAAQAKSGLLASKNGLFKQDATFKLTNENLAILNKFFEDHNVSASAQEKILKEFDGKKLKDIKNTETFKKILENEYDEKSVVKNSLLPINGKDPDLKNQLSEILPSSSLIPRTVTIIQDNKGENKDNVIVDELLNANGYHINRFFFNAENNSIMVNGTISSDKGKKSKQMDIEIPMLDNEMEYVFNGSPFTKRKEKNLLIPFGENVFVQYSGKNENGEDEYLVIESNDINAKPEIFSGKDAEFIKNNIRTEKLNIINSRLNN